MKTQIIQLEIHDDTTSLKDKMDWSQTARILLDCLQNAGNIRSKLDLVVLDRYCAAQGGQLALLTDDPGLRFQAQQLEIPVFESKTTAQQENWRRSSRYRRRQQILDFLQNNRSQEIPQKPQPAEIQFPPWSRIPAFSIGVLAVLALAAALLPSAVIQVPDSDQEKQIQIPVRASLDNTFVQVAGSIPAQIWEVEVETSESRETTGSILIPDEYSVGSITATNLTDNPLTIPEGTILSTQDENPILFSTLTEETIPAGINQQETIPIRAEIPGSNGNVAEGTISRMNASLGADLLISNPLPTSGGSDLTVAAPSQQDREILKKTALSRLESLADQQINQTLPGNLFQLCRQPSLSEITSEIYSPPEGKPGSLISVEISAVYSCLTANEADIKTLVDEYLFSTYRTGSIRPDSQTISYQHLGKPEMINQETASWNLEISWEEDQQLTLDPILPQVLGAQPSRAAKTIQDYYQLTEQPKISLFPAWWFRMPLLPFRVEIQ